MNRSSWAALSALLVSAFSTSEGRADLQCAAPIAQVGEVLSGAPLCHVFTLVNHGASPVEVVEVRPSCGCLTPHLDQRVLAPGQEGRLALEVNTLTPAEGPEVWRCTLVYREGEQKREVTLAVCGQVKCEIRVDPAALNISTRSTISHEIVVTDSRTRPFTVTGASTTSAHLRSQLLEGKASTGGHTWSVRLDVLADLPEGRHEEWVRITTNDPHYPALKVPVTIEKRRRESVVAAPPVVDWTASGTDSLPERAVLLRASSEQDVIVAKAECDQPGVQCSWVRGPGALATLRLTADRTKLAPGFHQASVHVQLANPAAETITLPVTWDLH
jgi:hypothetical protein